MIKIISNLLTVLIIVYCCQNMARAESTPVDMENPPAPESEAAKAPADAAAMLRALITMQEDIRLQTKAITKKIQESTSDTEKAQLKIDLEKLDRQLVEANDDFERIATNVEVAIFEEKAPENFSWREELGELIHPLIKELKRLTIRSRKKTKLRDTIQDYNQMLPVAQQAVEHLETISADLKDPDISKRLKVLLPEWQNIAQRLQNKLELATLELERIEAQDINLADSLSRSTKTFFRDRGTYLFGSIFVFFLILLLFRGLYRILFATLSEKTKFQLPFHIRLFDLLFRVAAIFVATLGCFLVLYFAEDWFLLSLAIIFFLGLTWTLRQGMTKMWQQARLMLNIGSVREGERIVINDIAWMVEKIQIFCTLYNPSLDKRIRLPIEEMVGRVSRENKPDEPWFPCIKNDWVVIGDRPRGKVISLSQETVELVERGGKRVFYQTADFLGASPVNLSRNFRLRIPFGVSYDLQSIVTTTVPEILKGYIEDKLKEKGYFTHCLNLSVEFKAAGESSLDLVILADFKGNVADIYTRLERYIQLCCVDACTIHKWEIPFPQLTFHWPEHEALTKGAS